MKRLLIVSHTPHYLKKDQIVGWEATIREIDALSTLFDEVVHLAPLHDGEAPQSSAPYASKKVIFKPVEPSGGARIHEKLKILARVPAYVSAIRHELKLCDAVHVRCPANISMVAAIMLSIDKNSKPCWFKYAGNWNPDGTEPWSYRFQRFLLRKGWHGGIVTVNGDWPGQPSFVRTFFNPSLSNDDLRNGREAAAKKHLNFPIKLLFAGRLEEAKGAGRVIEISEILRNSGIDFHFDLVGDGPERPEYENQAKMRGVHENLFFHGWLSRASLERLYSSAHLFVLPTRSSEGWPKVISEAMAFGAVPLAGAVSSIPQYLKRFQCGEAMDPMNVNLFAQKVIEYTEAREKWRKESENAVKSAELFSYDEYLKNVRKLFDMNHQAERVESGVLEARSL